MRTRTIWICLASLAMTGLYAIGGEPQPDPRSARSRARETGLTIHHMNGTKLAVGFTSEDKGSRVEKVEVWVTTDYGRKWTKYTEEKASVGQAIFEAKEEGTYEFATVGVDEIGNREKELDDTTRPDFRVVVDRTPPVIEVQGLKADAPVSSTLVTELTWKAEDAYIAENSVELEACFRKEGTWRNLASGLPCSGRRKFELPVAKDDVLDLRMTVKDLAGNLGTATVGAVTCDQLPPEATLSGPEVAKDLAVKIGATVTDAGTAGVSSAVLWVSGTGLRGWNKVCDLPVKPGEVAVQLPGAGTFGFAVSALDVAGNQLPPPGRGAKPLLTISTDTGAPKLEVLAWVTKGQVVSARSGVQIRWKAVDDNMSPQPVAIQFSENNGNAWADAAPTAMPADGSFDWKPAETVNSKQCLLRVAAIDLLGNKVELTSPVFTVDNSAPTTKAVLRPVTDEPVKAPEKPKAPVGPEREPAKKAPEPKKAPK